METYILKKSDRKGKRFVIIMPERGHKHHFGSDVGRTFIDGRTERERLAWHARHRLDKGYNNKHSGIYFSRFLLWGKHKTLNKNIKELEKKDNIRIKVEL
jgi:hypothetical protein